MMRRKVVHAVAPRVAAASSSASSSSWSTGCTVRTTNGSVTTISASSTPSLREGHLDPDAFERLPIGVVGP